MCWYQGLANASRQRGSRKPIPKIPKSERCPRRARSVIHRTSLGLMDLGCLGSGSSTGQEAQNPHRFLSMPAKDRPTNFARKGNVRQQDPRATTQGRAAQRYWKSGLKTPPSLISSQTVLDCILLAQSDSRSLRHGNSRAKATAGVVRLLASLLAKLLVTMAAPSSRRKLLRKANIRQAHGGSQP